MKKICAIFTLVAVLLLSACAMSGNADKGKVSELVDSLTQTPADMSDVENNGGAYVRVGERVYFRKYGPDALDTLAMFGEFVNGWVTGNESEIVFRDLKTGTLKTAFKDTGYGGLYVADNAFYLQERINRDDYVVRYSPDGGTCETVRKGTLLDITDSGLLAIQQYEGATTSFYFYRDGKEVGSYQSETGYLYAGLSDDGLFLLRDEDRSEAADGGGVTCGLWQLTPDGGTPIRLGTLPQVEYTYGAEAEQFLSTGAQIGLVVGYYAGTGHFLNDVTVVTATPGAENSLSVLDTAELDTDAEEGPESLPKLTVSEGGDIVCVPRLSGEVQIGWKADDNGDLKVYHAVLGGTFGRFRLSANRPNNGIRGRYHLRDACQRVRLPAGRYRLEKRLPAVEHGLCGGLRGRRTNRTGKRGL